MLVSILLFNQVPVSVEYNDSKSKIQEKNGLDEFCSFEAKG